MNIGTPDLVIAGIIVLSILIGILRGLVKESISLVTWIVAICLAVMYSEPLSTHMTFTSVGFVRNLTAFLLIFVGTVFVGALINFAIGGFIRKTPFSLPDRVLGSLFGLLRGMVFVTILVLLGGLTPFPETPWWKNSYAVSHFQELAIWLKDRLPDENAKVFNFPTETDHAERKKENQSLGEFSLRSQ